MTLVTSAAVEATVPDVVRAKELGLPHLTRPRIPRPAAQRRAAQRRGRRHQRQVDRHRHDRLDPPRLPSPADGDERRGDEEFRDAVGAVRERAGRRSRAVRQRGRRERRLDRALPARDRGADQHQPRPQGDGRAAAAVRRTSCNASRKAVLNLDDPETRALSETVPADKVIGYGFDSPGADFMGKDLQLRAERRRPSRSRPKARAYEVRLARARPPQCVERAGGDRRDARARRADRGCGRRRSAASRA